MFETNIKKIVGFSSKKILKKSFGKKLKSLYLCITKTETIMRTTSPELAYEGAINVIDNLYNVVKDFVKEHQGEKGYINTNIFCEEAEEKGFDGNDIIYGVEYCDEHEMGEERIVFGVRVKNDSLQVLMLPNWDNPTEKSYSEDDSWDDVSCGNSCYYLPTIINLAECIEEYVDETEK